MPASRRANGRGDVANEVVPGERGRPAPALDRLGECRLLDREERPHLVAGRRDDPDRRRKDQQRRPAGRREDEPGDDHQEAAGKQDAASPDPIRVGREPQRDHGVADERQGQDQADRQGIQAEGVQVQHEDHGEEAVPEHPQRPETEQEPAVAIEAAQARDQPRVRSALGVAIERV